MKLKQPRFHANVSLWVSSEELHSVHQYPPFTQLSPAITTSVMTQLHFSAQHIKCWYPPMKWEVWEGLGTSLKLVQVGLLNPITFNCAQKLWLFACFSMSTREEKPRNILVSLPHKLPCQKGKEVEVHIGYCWKLKNMWQQQLFSDLSKNWVLQKVHLHLKERGSRTNCQRNWAR